MNRGSGWSFGGRDPEHGGQMPPLRNWLCEEVDALRGDHPGLPRTWPGRDELDCAIRADSPRTSFRVDVDTGAGRPLLFSLEIPRKPLHRNKKKAIYHDYYHGGDASGKKTGDTCSDLTSGEIKTAGRSFSGKEVRSLGRTNVREDPMQRWNESVHS